jgi:apolipoprotein N-acyltransferase
MLADDTPTQEVALKGGNAEKQWATDITTKEGQRKLATYVRATESTKADLTVLPEGAFAATNKTLPLLTGPLRTTASSRHTTIVVGVILNQRQNTAMTIAAGAEIVEYRKWHDRGSKIEAGNTLEYVPGTTTGLTVCGDVNFPNPTRSYAAAGTP